SHYIDYQQIKYHHAFRIDPALNSFRLPSPLKDPIESGWLDSTPAHHCISQYMETRMLGIRVCAHHPI
ncbi:hypothetical protein DSO57_1039251, partial [Entomophthora muscae]